MCVQAQCTSPTGAREHAGTLCPTSLAQTVAEGLPGGGNNLFCIICRLFSICICVMFMLLFLSFLSLYYIRHLKSSRKAPLQY